ncbi:MAG: hypothetical protein IJT15_01395 [Rickettsiales bacterium]|nr:hypothetical protein [Rickettsiales bacterium]
MFSDKEKTFYIIDGYGFIFRAFYALPHLTAKNGDPIGAVYGFFKMLITLINSARPSHIAIALDTGHRTFRNDIYDEFLEKKHIHDLYANYKIQFFNVGLREEDIYAFNATNLMEFLKIDNQTCLNCCLELGIIQQNKDINTNYRNEIEMEHLLNKVPKLFILMYFLGLTEDVKVEEYRTQYKANKVETPQELRSQFKIVRELIDAMEIKTESIYGYEADDVIASIATDAVKKGMQVIVVSADKDLCQLVKDGEIAVYDPSKKKYLDEKGVIEKFGIEAKQVIDYLSIIGDSSDNVIGVNGIGPVGAVKLLKQYGCIDNILQNLDKLDKSTKEKIENSRDWLLLAQQLITLKYDAIKIDNIEDYKTNINHQKLASFMDKYGFRNLDKEVREKGFVKNYQKKKNDNTTQSQQHSMFENNNGVCKEDKKQVSTSTQYNNNIQNSDDVNTQEKEATTLKKTLFG